MKQSFLSIILVSCMCVLASCSSKSQVLFAVGETSLQMEGLNGNGRKGAISNPEKSSYAYLAFDSQQLPLLQAQREEGLSCWVRISPSGQEEEAPTEGHIAMGFLYDRDFSDSGRLKQDLGERPLARCLVSGPLSASGGMVLSMVVPTASVESLRGILLYSDTPLALEAAGVSPLMVGYREDYPSYYFCSLGGVWDRRKPLAGFDFTDARDDFAGKEGLAPVITLHLEEAGVMPSDRTKQPQLQLDLGGESIRVRRAPEQDQVSFHCLGLSRPFGPLALGQVRGQVRGVLMSLEPTSVRNDGSVVEPLVTDPGMIPLWPKTSWRNDDYELFQWEQFPGILFFDTASYKVQDDFFKRLAFFTEKTGYIGTLVSDEELVGQHGFNAHDYRSETLAAFFTLAEASRFPLNKKELLLRDILLHNGVIKEAANGYEGGYGAVISLSQESAMYLRYTFVAHEGFHGIFFVDEAFRSQVAAAYQAADPQSLHFLHRYFQLQSSLNYNLNDRYLMHNEFMAYVMQQPVNRAGSYFSENLARRGSMLRAEPELCAYIQSSQGAGFQLAAEELSRYTFGRWGLEAGRVSLVGR